MLEQKRVVRIISVGSIDFGQRGAGLYAILPGGMTFGYREKCKRCGNKCNELVSRTRYVKAADAFWWLALRSKNTGCLLMGG